MAAVLRSVAAAASNKGQSSSFYNKDKPNPVLQSLDSELKLFMGFVKKRNAPGYKRQADEAQSRPADTLFEIWNKYEPRLPKIYYQQKLLEIGDFLVSVKEYRLALWQCYDRYLMSFGDISVTEITDVETFKSIFFPQGFSGEATGLTFRALMGKSISMYQVVRVADPKLQNKQSVGNIGSILSFLRLIMQVILPIEKLCWLIYNGTVHIYSISRYLMSLGHSAKVLEFLLWACVCMETSVPLLAVKYLTWRSTLYAAVCQCYFDCKASQHAEGFARRGLSKINELSQLEDMSSSTESPEREEAFRQATVKMAIMVYKRTVFETRRRPKGLLRPKQRANLRDAQHLQWPRTPSEKLVSDMFEGSAAQFLCILEAINDTNRRIMIPGPAAPDNEVEVLDVYAELFMAGQELLAGGGGHRGSGPKPVSEMGIDALSAVVKGKSLIEMATRGEDGVTIDGAIKLVKYAFCFEQWDVFASLNESVQTYLRILNDDKYIWDEKALQILGAMEKLCVVKKHKPRNTTSIVEEEKETTDQGMSPSVTAHSAKSINVGDDLIMLADILMSVVTGPFSPESIEVDMIVDAGLYLWNKCKTVFQRYQTGSLDNSRYLQKMENPTKWVYILDVVHQILCWCGISSVDPALTAEVVLRLGLVLESSAQLDLEGQKKKQDGKSTEVHEKDRPTDGKSQMRDASMSDLAQQDGSQQFVSRTSMLSSSLQNVNPRSQLIQARDILELGLQNVSFARQAVALTDGKSIADVSWAKNILPAHKLPAELEEDHTSFLSPIAESPCKSLHSGGHAGSHASSASSEAGVPDLNQDLFTPEPGRDAGDVTADPAVNLTELGTDKLRGSTGSATAVWNTIKDLHLELTLMYHRVCLKLEQIGPDPGVSMPKPFKRRTCSKLEFGSDHSLADMYVESMEELLARANKNHLSRALLYMQKAAMLNTDGRASKEQRKLLENAVASIQKAQVEERRTYLDNTGVTDEQLHESKLPPPPILLSRTDSSMVFTPAPYKPATGEKVAWYRIFARSAAGSNVKARLNDYRFPGTGEEIPAHHKELKITGLRPNERYIVSVAAYTAEGKLIGDGVGESTKPILAIHPLPVLTTWAFLSQIAYQTGCYDICRRACDVLWDHFIADTPLPESETYVTSSARDFKLTLMRLNQKIVCLTSPVLLRQFLASIFVNVDISVQEKGLYCDVLCDMGPLYRGQLSRLKECEKMLVAMELAGWLNESNLALQAVVQCYGLLAPLIFYKIPSTPVIQLLQRCHAVLQEIPSGLRQKRQTSISDSLHHMTACITYHMAKVLRSWGQKSLSNNLNEAGRKLLAIESVPGEGTKDSKLDLELTNDLAPADTTFTEAGSINLQSLKSRRRGRRNQHGQLIKDDDGPMNEELKALEAHMLSITKQAQSDYDLSGNEDPTILHAYIAYLPSRIAYREVIKFRKRARYLEFFVHVAQKALTEGHAEMAREWCEETDFWIARRNETLIGTRAFLTKQPGGTMTVSGDDPKKFAAAMVEYSKEKRPASRQVDNRSKLSVASTAMLTVAPSRVRTGSQAGYRGPSKAGSTVAVKAKGDVSRAGSTPGGKGGRGHTDPSPAPSRIGGGMGGRGAANPRIHYIAEEDFLDEEQLSPRGTLGSSRMKMPYSLGPKPKRRKYKPLHVHPNMTESARQAQEEAEIRSLEKMTTHFLDMYRGYLRKKKLRRVCLDEMPWKCQLNIVLGLSLFSYFLNQLEKREQMMGNQDIIMYKTNFMDQEWFNFETCGTLIVGWEGGPLTTQQELGERKKELTKPERESDEEWDDDLKTTGRTTDALDLAGDRPKTTATGIEIAAAITTGAPPPSMFVTPAEVEDTPRTYRSDNSTARNKDKQKPTEIIVEVEPLIMAQDTIDILNKCFASFRKAIVLAHRGQHWTLLQNACRAMWNSVHTALLRAYTPSMGNEDNGLLTIDELRSLIWKPLHVAADCVLDMMDQLQLDLEQQAAKGRSKPRKMGKYFESWMGDVTTEKGGASLKFDDPQDDNSVVDSRWIRRLILRVLEVLYYEEKWEKLVDIGLRFNALTNDRYSEQVLPLLVQAQRKLQEGIEELGGNLPPQPHYQKLMQRLNTVVSARTYMTQQLEVVLDRSNIPKMALGAGIDPLGHGLYTSKDALKNISVPLDVSYSLSVLYEAFDKSQYTSRALQHSRRLMVLYMASQQNTLGGGFSRQPSRVDFVPNTARPQPTMPVDLTGEEYLDPSDVQTVPIPSSQLGTVIRSYEKTIEMLMAKNERALAAQAMHEIGNIQYHSGNIRAAYKWWADALDLTLDADDAIHTWRDLFKDVDDMCSEMLNRCGIWGCVFGGILASNIAQYVLTSDLGLRTECCFLSGNLFKALFRASLPHPLADKDYALYDVGEGCEVTNLIPGIDLLSERFRSDGRQLVAALRWVTEELARGQHNLFVLPLLTLNQYFCTFMSRDLQRSVDGRIVKVRVLTDLGLFTEAMIVLQRLLHGERLPYSGDSSFRQVESKIPAVKFNTAKPIMEPSNLKILEIVLDKRLSAMLGTTYGPHMTCHLSLVQAHLFVAIAKTIPVLPCIEDVILPEGQNVLRQVTLTTATKPSPSKISRDKKSKDGKDDVIEEKEEWEESDGTPHEGVSCSQLMKRFSGAKKPLTQEFVKGTLLVVAEQMVSTISDVIQENAELEKGGLEGLSAVELELVILCKLEQNHISRLKHHGPMAARIALSALKLLQSSSVFRKKKGVPVPPRPSSMKKSRGSSGSRRQPMISVRVTEPENSQFQYQNFQSRSRLDARLWLTCRSALVSSLMMEIRGMGEVKGSDNKVLQEIADCRQYCVEGLGEAEACGDVEKQAEFLVQGAYLNIVEGKNLEHTVSLLQDAVDFLSKQPCRSVPGDLDLATALVFKTDLEAVNPTDESVLFTERTMEQYLLAQRIVLKQMEDLGETIEHFYPEGRFEEFSAPTSPMKNIYLPHCLRLVQIKLRVGHAMARNTAKNIRAGTDRNHAEMWTNTLRVLMTALEISKVMVTREAYLEAELLLNMGKVERMMVYLGMYKARAAVHTLSEAIKISHATDHNLGLMRQAYLEIALVYLYSSGLAVLKDGTSIDVVSMDSGDEVSSVKTGRSSSMSKKKKKFQREKSKLKSKDDMNEQEKERNAAWLAIRCAASVANTQRQRHLLTGDVNVTSQKLSETAQQELPDFIALDLVNSYVLGEKKKVYKNEIEEELAPLIEAQEVKRVETYDEQILNCKDTAKDLGWIHFLGYQTILQRLCSTSTISASSAKAGDAINISAGDLGPDFDLGFISHAQCDTSMNHDVVRSMLFSGLWSVRLSKLHAYLAENLRVYGSDCCAIYPPAALLLPMTTLDETELDLKVKSYPANLTHPADWEGDTMMMNLDPDLGMPPVPPGFNKDSVRPQEKSVVSPKENEVTLQWYQPSLEETDPARPEASGKENRILLLYALNNVLSGAATPVAKFVWVPLSHLNDLHDRLAVLMQRAEIYLKEKPSKPVKIKDLVAPTPTPAKTKKSQQRLKALSAKVQKDQQLEGLLRQCIDDIGNLLGAPVEQDTSSTTTELFPFEVSKVNIKMLEALFDPSFGANVKGTDMAQWLMKVFPVQ